MLRISRTINIFNWVYFFVDLDQRQCPTICTLAADTHLNRDMDTQLSASMISRSSTTSSCTLSTMKSLKVCHTINIALKEKCKLISSNINFKHAFNKHPKQIHEKQWLVYIIKFRTPPPVQILSISCSLWENLGKSYVGATPPPPPPTRVGAPTSGKSWIRH